MVRVGGEVERFGRRGGVVEKCGGGGLTGYAGLIGFVSRWFLETKDMSLVDRNIPDIFTGDADEMIGCLIGFAKRWFLETKEMSRVDRNIPDIF